MKLILDRRQLDMNPEQFLRRVGYSYIRDRRSGSESFVRRLGSGFYPRFHIYAEEQGEKAVFNLHLDQKQPSYGGTHMHNAEYGGEAVEGEMERLKKFITHSPQPATQESNEESIMDKIGGDRNYNKNIKTENNKKWWKFW